MNHLIRQHSGAEVVVTIYFVGIVLILYFKAVHAFNLINPATNV